MDRMLYVAMNGAKHILQAQTATSNNLANASTTGFREDYTQFRSMPVFGDGYPSRVFAQSERPGINFNPGPIISTGRELDMAVRGEGWVAVQSDGGDEAYTRAGDLRTTVTGQLVTGTGKPVIGNDGPIAIPPAKKIEIGDDGTISYVPLNAQATELVVLDRIKLVNPPLEELEKGTDGLFRQLNGEDAVADADVTLISGALEGSNVNTVHALVQMIDYARNFEMHIKAMETADENAQATTRMMAMSGG